ncbi:MAG TPA: hypothetical protein DIT01_06950 [Lentisphaeria bacterium]|nr:hypothetical protein [Lentisphaeria bacterium]
MPFNRHRQAMPGEPASRRRENEPFSTDQIPLPTCNTCEWVKIELSSHSHKRWPIPEHSLVDLSAKDKEQERKEAGGGAQYGT